MLFNLFGKKRPEEPTQRFTDRIYISVQAKHQACLELAKQEPETLFITWFSESTRQLREFFKPGDISENRVIEARSFHSAMLHDKKAVFAEHHPLHEKERSLVSGWEQKDILVFSALEEPLFSAFGGEKIISLMKQLGMKEDEPIEHPMVSRSILNAQEKIAKKVIAERPAHSPSEWMTLNLK
ncbi:MAG: hypothetical protein IPI66_06195 [Chitinophagaceae bacterium]|nr:hypothetical protein [Chitinophagaceae bacterium]